ncbi:Hypothetical predicted protein [Pelobates cultripes]|uniref:Uncharacterized protein n=1 Tax=Pelobates cultripes TaxID=61616 RepID=A0AAD1WG02_PELCU|nr:Hypothetical predicted protein [Pelobates cultripes]
MCSTSTQGEQVEAENRLDKAFCQAFWEKMRKGLTPAAQSHKHTQKEDHAETSNIGPHGKTEPAGTHQRQGTRDPSGSKRSKRAAAWNLEVSIPRRISLLTRHPGARRYRLKTHDATARSPCYRSNRKGRLQPSRWHLRERPTSSEPNTTLIQPMPAGQQQRRRKHTRTQTLIEITGANPSIQRGPPYQATVGWESRQHPSWVRDYAYTLDGIG